MGPKSKKGEAKKSKNVLRVGRMLIPNRDFCGPPRVHCKNPFGNRLRVSGSEIDYQTWRSIDKWPGHILRLATVWLTTNKIMTTSNSPRKQQIKCFNLLLNPPPQRTKSYLLQSILILAQNETFFWYINFNWLSYGHSTSAKPFRDFETRLLFLVKNSEDKNNVKHTGGVYENGWNSMPSVSPSNLIIENGWKSIAISKFQTSIFFKFNFRWYWLGLPHCKTI